MPELTTNQIEQIYQAEGLTPVLVVKAGGDSYGHSSAGDYDYFGYHLENVPAKNGDEFLYQTADVNMRSWPISMISDRIEGKEGPMRAMWCIDHWIWHTPLVTTEPQYSNIRSQIAASKDEEWMRFYAYSAFRYFKAWKANPSNTKSRNRAIRVALTVKYYLDHGQLECNFQTLLAEYPVGTDAERRALKKELKQIWLELIADRINWRSLE